LIACEYVPPEPIEVTRAVGVIEVSAVGVWGVVVIVNIDSLEHGGEDLLLTGGELAQSLALLRKRLIELGAVEVLA
jgi:hypothetical protein